MLSFLLSVFDLLTDLSFDFIEEVIFCVCPFFRVAEGNQISLKDTGNRWLHHRQGLVLITITSLSFCLLATAVCSPTLGFLLFQFWILFMFGCGGNDGNGNGRCCWRSDDWVVCSVAWDLFTLMWFRFSCFGGSKFIACSRFVFRPFDLTMVDSYRSLPLLGPYLGSSSAFSEYFVLHFIFWWIAPWFCVATTSYTWLKGPWSFDTQQREQKFLFVALHMLSLRRCRCNIWSFCLLLS